MLERVIRTLRELFGGRRLARAVRRHDRAAHELDAAIREVLRK